MWHESGATSSSGSLQMIVKNLKPLFPKCDYGKISVKHVFSLVALSRMSGIHKSILEGCSF